MSSTRSRLWRLVPIVAVILAACQEEPATGPEPGAPDKVPSLAEASAVPAFVQVTQGGSHTCALTGEGDAWCWGSNHLGPLGDGTETDHLVPHPVTGGLRFQSISAGNLYTCGLATDGAAWCWGSNFERTLGHGGSELFSLVPVAVAGDHRFRQLRASDAHVCAVALDDVVWCWGRNHFGQLGVSWVDVSESPVPLRVESGGRAFRRVLTGADHTCALTPGGKAFCWGENSSGQLGNGTVEQTFSPTRVLRGLTFSQLSAGDRHTCGVSAGTAYCWGTNAFGGLGDGTKTNRLRPTAVSGGLRFKGVSAGALYSCGITADDLAYCWGLNHFGQLGIGTFGVLKSRAVPTRVLGGHTFSAIGGMSRGSHTCAVTPDQRVYCWGENGQGQLGIGTLIRSKVPALVN